MKKLIVEIMGCVAVYYVMEAVVVVSMARVWSDLGKNGAYTGCKRTGRHVSQNVLQAQPKNV